METIVSITPLRVQEDSRTFKIAASFARFGYKSIVVEGLPSSLSRTVLPFELKSMKVLIGSDGKSAGLAHDKATGLTIGIWKRIGAILRRALRGIAWLPFEFMSVCETAGESHYLEDPRQKLNVWRKIVKCVINKFVRPTYDLLPSPLQRLYQLFIGNTCFLIYLSYYTLTYILHPLCYLPRASLYYLHAPLNFPAVYLLCKRYRVPFIYDAHDFYIGIEEHRSPFEQRWLNPFLLRLERSCIKHAAAVVTVCDGVARLQEETFKCHPVVVRNCQDCRLEKNPQITLRQLLGLSANDFLVVTIGTAKRGMAIEESLDAIRKLPSHVHLALLGKNTDQHIDLIRQRGLEGRVHGVPPVMPFEVVPFISSAEASLIVYYPRSANYENCLPNGFFQAIAAELPLLYPELPEITKIAKQYNLGIPINPLDPESIRSGVLQLMADPERFSIYRENLRVAKAELSWEREEVILRELLCRVLDKEGCEQ